MEKIRSKLLGSVALLIILLSFGAVSAAVTDNAGTLQVDTTTLTDSTNFVENVSGSHNTNVTGTFTLNNTNTAGGAAITVTGITPAILYLAGDATSTYSIPASAITFANSSGTAIPTTGATLSIAADSGEVITYTVAIPNLQFAGTYKLSTSATAGTAIVSTDGTTSPGFDFEVIVNEDHSISLSETSVSKTVVLGNSATYNYTIVNAGNVNETVTFNLTDLELNWKNSENITAPSITSTTVAANTTLVRSFTITSSTTDDKYGIYSSTLGMTAGSVTDSATIKLTTDRSTDDGVADLDNYDDIDDLTGEDDEWRPGDIIRINDLELNNLQSNYILEDTSVEITLYKVSNGKKYAEYESDRVDIDEDDTLEDTYELQIPYDAPEGDYILTIYLVGEREDNSSEKHSDLVFSEIIDVERDSRHIVIESFEFSSTDVSCGDSLTADVKITNIGTKDLDDDDSIKLTLESSDLNVDETRTIDKLKEDKSDTETFSISVPSNKAKGSYLVTATVEYRSDDNDDGTSITKTLALGDCEEVAGSSTISGTGSASGSAGEDLTYVFTVSNSGSTASDYTLEVSGISDWASVRIEPSGTLNLGAGESTTVTVYVTPNLNSSGTQTATVNVKSAGSTVSTKSLTANVASGQVTITTFTSATLSELGSQESLLYTSMILNIVLLLIVFSLIYPTRIAPIIKEARKARSKKGSKGKSQG